MMIKRIEELLMETREITSNPILEDISKDRIQEIDLISNTNNTVKSYRDEISKRLNSVGIIIDNVWFEIIQKYNECLFYIDMKKRGNIERILECNSSTPDFKIDSKEGTLYLEYKTVMFQNALQNYKDLQKKSLDNQIKLENGASFVFLETKPYFKKQMDYCPYSKRTMIETWIEKFGNNYKQKQFTNDCTFLVLDLTHVGTMHTRFKGMLPYFYDEKSKSIVTGEYWTSAFGKMGMLIQKIPEYEGASPYDGELQREGILIQFPNIGGVIFRVKLHKGEIQNFCLIKSEFAYFQDIIFKYFDIYNDEINSQQYMVCCSDCGAEIRAGEPVRNFV